MEGGIQNTQTQTLIKTNLRNPKQKRTPTLLQKLHLTQKQTGTPLIKKHSPPTKHRKLSQKTHSKRNLNHSIIASTKLKNTAFKSSTFQAKASSLNTTRLTYTS
jgi:hypothetical protein